MPSMICSGGPNHSRMARRSVDTRLNLVELAEVEGGSRCGRGLEGSAGTQQSPREDQAQCTRYALHGMISVPLRCGIVRPECHVRHDVPFIVENDEQFLAFELHFATLRATSRQHGADVKVGFGILVQKHMVLVVEAAQLSLLGVGENSGRPLPSNS